MSVIGGQGGEIAESGGLWEVGARGPGRTTKPAVQPKTTVVYPMLVFIQTCAEGPRWQ